ncbi:hypothetical protein ACVWWI_006326 [Bradyrhizobium sp. USDA 3686]|uniref:hypothetical protein n=1 Tax=Bradyrhizobium canariense TaxID=255045 RepID=UPI00195BDA8E|nr:hypothetical protein [Bradyrhizobium canariense]MBM7488123.1 hypothetical protein [Bradyrhizobium canariense]
MKLLRWSVQAGRNVFLVPIIPNRVSFAILVLRALDELEESPPSGIGREPLDDRDIVAVTLPELAAEAYQEALQCLPTISVLLLGNTVQSGPEYRELLSVGPTDGFTEALRSAGERRCKVRFLDIPLDPSALIKNCASAFPPSFDDGTILSVGAAEFLTRWQGILSTPPVRTEPIDSAREAAIAASIQRLAPMCRRLIVFCSSSLLLNIKNILPFVQRPNVEIGLRSEKMAVSRFDAGERELLFNIDDFPYFAEFYEEERQKRRIGQFDKLKFVEECLLRISSQIAADQTSTRRALVLSDYLRNLCRTWELCSPNHSVVLNALKGSLSTVAAQAALNKLYSYRGKLDTKVGWNSRGDLRLFSRRQQDAVGRLRIVRRDCSPNNAHSIVGGPEAFGGGSGNAGGGRNRDWSPVDFHYERLESIRQRVLRVAVSEGSGFKVQEFQGSIERGIDVRRSVRSIVRDGKLFVKVKVRGLRPLQIRTAPIVWIMRQQERASISTHTASIDFGRRSGDKNINDRDYEFVRCQHAAYDSQITKEMADPNVTVGFFYIAGRISFLPFIGNVKADFFSGNNVLERVPNHKAMVHPEDVGCLDPRLEPLADQRNWDELLLLTASLYAERCVVLVAPQSYEVEPRVHRALTGRKQQLLRVNIDVLSSTERFWLERSPAAQGKTEKISEERYEAEIWPELERVWGSVADWQREYYARKDKAFDGLAR